MGQKGVNPTVASLILCLESVVAVVAGWLFLGETLSVREFVGCALMFVAIVMAQLPISNKKKISPIILNSHIKKKNIVHLKN